MQIVWERDRAEQAAWAPAPVLVPDWFIFMQMRSPNLQFDWSTWHGPNWSEPCILIGHHGATLVNKDANEDVTVQLQLDRAGPNPLV